MKGTTLTWLLAGQSILLVVAIVGLFSLRQQVQGLEARVDSLQSSEPVMASFTRESRSDRDRDRRPERPRRIVSGAASEGAASAAAPSEAGATMDDQLWSEDGREAIGDVVAEREEEERERRSERWQQMMSYRSEKAVSAVSDELGLSEADTERVSELVAGFMEARSAHWEQMHSEAEVDFAEVDRQYEEARAQIESDLIDVIGEEGLEVLRGEMRGRRGGGFR